MTLSTLLILLYILSNSHHSRRKPLFFLSLNRNHLISSPATDTRIRIRLKTLSCKERSENTHARVEHMPPGGAWIYHVIWCRNQSMSYIFLLLGSWGLLWSFQISFCSPIRRLTIQCPTWPEENKTCLGSLSCTPRSMSLYCTLTNQLIIDSLPYSLTKDRCIHSSLYPTSVVWKVKQCTREWFESRTSWVEACRRQSRSLEWCRA